jgi:hypothetical protein
MGKENCIYLDKSVETLKANDNYSIRLNKKDTFDA